MPIYHVYGGVCLCVSLFPFLRFLSIFLFILWASIALHTQTSISYMPEHKQLMPELYPQLLSRCMSIFLIINNNATGWRKEEKKDCQPFSLPFVRKAVGHTKKDKLYVNKNGFTVNPKKKYGVYWQSILSTFFAASSSSSFSSLLLLN